MTLARSTVTSGNISHWRHFNPRDLVVFPALKLLGIFNEAYMETNIEKSSVFWGNYVTWLANQWDKTSIQFLAIFQIALSNTNIEFGQSGPFVFLRSLVRFPLQKFANEIYIVSQQFHRPSSNGSQIGGIVLRSPLKCQKEAASFVVSLFEKIVSNTSAQTEITVYLIDEFLWSIKGHCNNASNLPKNSQISKVSAVAIDILALKLSEVVNVIVKNDSKKLIKDVNFILSTTNDPMMLGEGMSNLGVALFGIHKDKININEWKVNAGRILSRILKDILVSEKVDNFGSTNDLVNALNFIDKIDNYCGVKKTILLLSKDDLNRLLGLLKDKNTELSLRIIKIIQQVLN